MSSEMLLCSARCIIHRAKKGQGISAGALSVWGMVTRGTKQVGVQGAEYAIDRYTAVQLYTAGSAELNWESDRRGSIKPRKLADLVAYRADPMTCPIDDLLSLRPTFTMVGGRAVYNAETLFDQEERT